jgi:hypothetical protein
MRKTEEAVCGGILWTPPHEGMVQNLMPFGG